MPCFIAWTKFYCKGTGTIFERNIFLYQIAGKYKLLLKAGIQSGIGLKRRIGVEGRLLIGVEVRGITKEGK